MTKKKMQAVIEKLEKKNRRLRGELEAYQNMEIHVSPSPDTVMLTDHYDGWLSSHAYRTIGSMNRFRVEVYLSDDIKEQE